LLKTLATLAAHGDAVLVGRGSNFALRWSQNGLHVRIVGSLEARAERFTKCHQMKPEEARRHLLAVDADRRAFVKHHFLQNYDDIGFYHAVFNTDHLSVQQVVESIMSLLNLGNANPALEPDLKVLNV